MNRPVSTSTALTLIAVTLAACDSRSSVPYGDGNSIVAGMDAALWAEVEEDAYRILEPTTYTVRDEENFTVTYADPAGEHWANLRRFRVMLIVGRADDWFVAEALERAVGPAEGPGIHEARDVWANQQTVTVLVLSPDGGADEVRAHLPALQSRFEERFRRYVVNRMYTSGPDSLLADSLRATWGFTLLLPTVYRYDARDAVHIFRNDNPDPSELIRQFAVTWVSPLPPDLKAENLIEWRDRLAMEYYTHGQDIQIDGATPMDFHGEVAYEIRGRWTNPPELNWPAGGLFILRGIPCHGQDRMYLVDSWLYAPGKEHYEYVVQMETILDTFRCGATP